MFCVDKLSKGVIIKGHQEAFPKLSTADGPAELRVFERGSLDNGAKGVVSFTVLMPRGTVPVASSVGLGPERFVWAFLFWSGGLR